MGIGLSIFVAAVGAILFFAVNATVAGLDISAVGVILMLAGGVMLGLTLLVFAPRNRRSVTQTVTASPAVGSSTTTTQEGSIPPAP